MSQQSDTLTALALGAGALALSACGGGGGGSSDDGDGLSAPPTLTFDAVTLTVHTDNSDSVTIDDAATTAVDSNTHRRRIPLDGSSKTRDPGPTGGETAYAFDIDAGSETALLELIVNPIGRRFVDGTDAFSDKRHLLSRTGFNVDPHDLARFADVDLDTMVDIIIDELRSEPVQAAPAFASEPIYNWRERQNLSADARDAYNDNLNRWRNDLRAWWYREMYHTPSPLTERLVLFWHGVWTSSLDSCPVPHMMWVQNSIMRSTGTTNFASMAHKISKDPAMVRYLDSDSNVKESPNENFARELMELFSLGEGMDYNEADIPEIARAFSGYNLDDHWFFDYRPERHDYGSKTYFGTTHDFTSLDESIDGFSYLEGDHVIDQILAKDRCAVYVCERLWDEFVALDRDTAAIANLATILRDNNYALRPVLRSLFKSDAFRDAKGGRIKSPVELMIGTHRSLQTPPDEWNGLIWRMSTLGQSVMYPPNVRGWPTNTDWITAESYLQRRTLLGWMAWDLRHAVEGDSVDTSALADLLLASAANGSIRTDTPRNQLNDILQDLAYQLS